MLERKRFDRSDKKMDIHRFKTIISMEILIATALMWIISITARSVRYCRYNKLQSEMKKNRAHHWIESLRRWKRDRVQYIYIYIEIRVYIYIACIQYTDRCRTTQIYGTLEVQVEHDIWNTKLQSATRLSYAAC